MCIPHFLLEEGEGGKGVNFQPNYQKGGALTRPEFLEGLAGKEARDFFQGGCSFYVKNKLKSEIFNYKKKFINENIFLCPN